MSIKLERLWCLILLLCALQSCDKDSLEDVNGAPIAHGDTFSVKEDVDEQTIIGTIEATDPDDDKLIFEIRSGGNGLFEISPEGEISLAPGKYLDYESVKEHSLVVMVSDGKLERFRGVRVKVEDMEETIGNDPSAFVTTWKTNTDTQTIYIGANSGYDYNFTIDWGDGTVQNIFENTPEYFDHTYTTAGTYTVSIIGDFPAINMFNVYELYGEEQNLMLASIERWGDIEWKSLLGAFSNCSQMKYNATDVPNLESTSSTAAMFINTDFNADLNDWKTGNVTEMSYMFAETDAFNGDISDWDTSKVTNMYGMFSDAIAFNSDLSDWDVSNVEIMAHMFGGAEVFNGDLSSWDTSSVTNMSSMFFGATSFDQNLGGWDIGSVNEMHSMFEYSGISTSNLSNTIIGWSSYADQNDGPYNITVGLDNLSICLGDGINALQNLSDNYQWDYTGNLNLVQCN